MSSNIRNTSKTDPLLHLAGVLTGGTSGYIEDMEAAGAAQVANQDATGWVDVPDRGSEKLADLGFIMGERPDPTDPDADKLFRKVQLPEGWSIERTGHSMWTKIVDEGGYQRVSMFYKAAFYDRAAHLTVDALPLTKAQTDAGDEFYDDGWVMDYTLSERQGPDVLKVYQGQYGSERPQEDRRFVLVGPDGTIKSDEVRQVEVSS